MSTQEADMWSRTIGLIVTLVLGLLAAPLTGDAQQAAAVVGWLNPQPLSSSRKLLEAV